MQARSYPILVLLSLAPGWVDAHLDNYCLPSSKSGELRFSAPLAGADFAYRGEAKTLYCCATGYDRLTWYKLVDGAYQAFPLGRGRVTLVNRNQTLVLRNVVASDDGWYRCVVEKYGSGEQLTNLVKVKVLRCRREWTPPVVVDRPRSAFAQVGDSVAFRCSGRFSCSDFPFASVVWTGKFKNELGEEVFRRLEDVAGFSLTRFNRSNGSILGADLTVTNVKEDQFNRDFSCHLSTPNPQSPVIPVRILHRSQI